MIYYSSSLRLTNCLQAKPESVSAQQQERSFRNTVLKLLNTKNIADKKRRLMCLFWTHLSLSCVKSKIIFGRWKKEKNETSKHSKHINDYFLHRKSDKQCRSLGRRRRVSVSTGLRSTAAAISSNGKKRC